MRAQFLLDPDVIFLNHGSFGACPRPVFETYQAWQRELERQPVAFLGRRVDALLGEARQHLAAYLGASADDLVFVPNATIGLNAVARSLDLQPGDEILTTDHEYGAMTILWREIAQQRGARLVIQPLALPLSDPEAVAEAFWQGVTERTRVIFMSHITSSTALILPVESICRRAREAGLLTVVDSAHVPGQLALDVNALNADIVAGNLHKWLCAPKGAGFLWVHPAQQRWVHPLAYSWGFREDAAFVTWHQWQGTRDVAAYLSVPAAIDFQRQHDWDAVRQRCHALALTALHRLAALTGLAPIAHDRFYGQMIAAPLPEGDHVAWQARLYGAHRVEVPFTAQGGRGFVRVSVQGYNTPADIEHLLEAMASILAEVDA